MKKSTKTVTTPASPAPVPAKKAKVAVKSIAAKAPASPKPVVAAKVAPVAAAPEKAAKAVVKKAAKPAKATKPVAETPATPAPAPVAKAPEAPAAVTTVVAHIDVGFGNTLFIRGEGPGLSWETGKILDCVADDKWSITFADAKAPVVFKFLVNDLTWSTGEDYSVEPGASVVLTPVF